MRAVVVHRGMSNLVRRQEKQHARGLATPIRYSFAALASSLPQRNAAGVPVR